MPYKISGTLEEAARIIIIKESDWSIEANSEESSGAYEVGSLAAGYKWIIARKSDGEAVGYGLITPVEYTPPGRGIFAGGSDAGYTRMNVISYVTISTIGEATDFGDLTAATQYLTATSNA